MKIILISFVRWKVVDRLRLFTAKTKKKSMDENGLQTKGIRAAVKIVLLHFIGRDSFSHRLLFSFSERRDAIEHLPVAVDDKHSVINNNKWT